MEFQLNISKLDIIIEVFDVPRSKIENISPLIPKLKEQILIFEKRNYYVIK